VDRITVIDDLSTGKMENLGGYEDVRVLVHDLEDNASTCVVAEADVVFHLAVRNVRASIKDPIENMRVNSQGTIAMLDALRRGGTGSFVYVSSSEVYGIPENLDFSEMTLPEPTTVYGAGKLAGEFLTKAYSRTYGLETRVIRPFNNYGPRSHFEGDSGEVIPKFVLRALAGVPLLIHGDGTQTRDFMYVEETAKWLSRLAEEPSIENQTVNIGTGVETSILGLAEVVLSKTGSNSSVEFTEERPGDLPRLRAEVSKVTELVDFELSTDLNAGLDQTIEYFSHFNPVELLEAERANTWT
jgi:UDP-glucose 4-epimerase